MSTPLDPTQRAAAAQFDRQSHRYGRSHLLADTSDVAAGLTGVPPAGGSPALDVATGGGHTALCLARRGHAVTITDVAPRMLAQAAQLLADEGFGCTRVLAPAEALTFPAGHFAVVTCRVAAHHFSAVEQFVREVARVLRPGGHFLLIDGSVPDDDPETEAWLHHVEVLRDPTHGRFLSRRAWERQVEAAGLRVLRATLQPLKQPDLEGYFDTAATPAPNRARVRQAVVDASRQVRAALRLGEEDGRTVWFWPRLTLLAQRPPGQGCVR